MKRQLGLLLFTAVIAPLAALAGPVLSLNPSDGAVWGNPGSVTGWGFTLTNPDPNFVVVNSVEFCTTVNIAGFTVCDQYPAASLGTFLDFMGPNFIVAGPAPESPSVTQAFNNGLLTGVGSFSFSPVAIPRSTFAGEILVNYDLYSRSPNDPGFDPSSDFLGSSSVTASASASVNPEPGTLFLMAGAAALLAAKQLRRAFARW